jgi:O-antigen/teichoic acid export membrane protein
MKFGLKSILFTDKTKVILDQALYSGTTFLTILIFARTLQAYDFGVFVSIQLYTFLLMSISSAFVVQPMQVLYGTYKENKSYLSATVLMQLGVMLITFFAVSIICFLDRYYDFGWSMVLFPAGAYAIATILFDYVRKRLLVENKMNKLLVIELLVTFSQIAAAAISYFLELSISQVLILMTLGFLPSIVFFIGYLINSTYIKTESLDFLKTHFKQAQWLAPTAIVQWLTSNFFVATSGLILGVEALGAFRLVQTLFGLINVLLQGIESYVLPQASIRFQQSKQVAYEYLKTLIVKTIFPVVIILLVMFVFADQIILLAGGKAYITYGFVIRWMVILYVIILVNYPVRMLIRLHEMNHLFLSGYIISFVLSLSTASYLLSNFQLTGAIIGLGLNQLVLFAIWQYSLHKKERSLWKSFT